METIGKNIKALRKKYGYTQQELADKIEIKKSLVGAIEEGRSFPRVNVAMRISKLLDCSIEQLLNSNLSNDEIGQMDPEGKNIRILTIPVDSEQNEQITLVPVSARAGYSISLSNPNYINKLPTFSLPLKQVSNFATYRMFEISGDSMLPNVEPGSYLLTEYIQNWRELKNGSSYVFVSKFDGLFYKRIQLKKDSIVMSSDNKEFEDYEIKANEILEIWKPTGYISFNTDRFTSPN